jgi:hypothetical protein
MSSREQYDAAQQHEWERAAGVQLGRCERAEALVGRYRAALEQIAGYGCRCDAGWGEFDDAQCPSCVARAVLEEK